MTRDEMKAKAVELRGQGVFIEEIAVYLGVSKTTAVRWTNPAYEERSRVKAQAWKDAHREQNRARDRQYLQDSKTPCPWCWAPCMADEACRDCRHAWALVRQTLVEGMWADGWTIREISGALGVDAQCRLGNWRDRDGWDLPYRYRNTKRQVLAEAR